MHNRQQMPARDPAIVWYDRNAGRYQRSEPGLAGEAGYYAALARSAPPPALDLCCGGGRVTRAIAAAGVPVTGLDLSPAMIADARAMSGGLPNIQFVQCDVRSFSLPERFGMVCLPYRSFSHMLTTADQRTVLQRAFSHLQPGGLLALNLVNPLPLTRLLGKRGLPGKPLYAEPYPGARVRHVFPDEMEMLLSAAGYVSCELRGWFDGRLFTVDSSEQVWTARRPAV